MAAETMEQRLAELEKRIGFRVYNGFIVHADGTSAPASREVYKLSNECLRLMALNERTLNAAAFAGIKIVRSDYLPKATILASADVCDSMALPEGEEGR